MNEIGATERLVVRQMVWESDGVLSLWLSRADRSELPPWSEGAHIDLQLEGGVIRQYSLCGDPANAREWKVAVLYEPAGTGGSRYVHERLRPGHKVDVLALRNNFPLVAAPRYRFVAGGIGVTPLIPMIHALQARGADWRLLYGGRARASMAFLEELTALGPHVAVMPEDEFGLLDVPGVVLEAGPEAAIYTCGPEPLIAAVEAECERQGRPAPHVERFKARPLDPDAEGWGPNTAFEIVLHRSGKRLLVPADKTIIQVLDEARVFVPTSCTEGYCGTCETPVLEGIPEHRDDYLTPQQRESNKMMMVCCGRSKTPEIVLDL